MLAGAQAETVTTPEVEVAKTPPRPARRRPVQPRAARPEAMFKALVFDASGIKEPAELGELCEFFGPTIRAWRPRAGSSFSALRPRTAVPSATRRRSARSRASSVRSARRRATGYRPARVRRAEGGRPGMASTLRFLLSPSRPTSRARWSGCGVEAIDEVADWDRPLRQGRSRHRRLARHRRRDRSDAGPRRCQRDRARRARRGRRSGRDDVADRRRRPRRRHHR